MRTIARMLIGLVIVSAVAYVGYMGMEGSHRLVNGYSTTWDPARC